MHVSNVEHKSSQNKTRVCVPLKGIHLCLCKQYWFSLRIRMSLYQKNRIFGIFLKNHRPLIGKRERLVFVDWKIYTPTRIVAVLAVAEVSTPRCAGEIPRALWLCCICLARPTLYLRQFERRTQGTQIVDSCPRLCCPISPLLTCLAQPPICLAWCPCAQTGVLAVCANGAFSQSTVKCTVMPNVEWRMCQCYHLVYIL